MRATCKYCGEEFEYEKSPSAKPRQYCNEKCRSKMRLKKRRDSLTTLCIRCGKVKPRSDFRSTLRTCKDCEKIKSRVCKKCGEEKAITHFSGTMHTCRKCRLRGGVKIRKHNGGRSDACVACEHNGACRMLVAAKIAPLCFEPDDNDPYYLALMPEPQRRLAERLLEARP